MIQMQLSEAAAVTNGVLHGNDVEFSGVSTDSRTTKSGDLFVALNGPNFDGHDWVSHAAEAGAKASLIQRQLECQIPTVEVADTLAALGALASAWRQRFDIPVIGVTGSAGKTTVKEMIGAVMRRNFDALVTAGNLNNEIGVPLTLFRLGPDTEVAVVEMGASKRGDIAYLAKLAQPQIGIVTLCAPAHLEGFGDVQTVAETKGEMFANLSPAGTAIVNNEDQFAGLWRSLAADRTILSFGKDGDVCAQDIQVEAESSSFRLITPGGQASCRIPLGGRHNVNNALAAAAACVAAGIDLDSIVAGLNVVDAAPGRLNFIAGIHGCRVIDDTYNANPASMKAALDVLAAYPGEKWFVLGDMGELGAEAGQLHQQVAQQAAAAGVSRLFAVGPLSRAACDVFEKDALHFESSSDLADAVDNELQAAVTTPTILVKASRAMALDRVVQRLSRMGAEPC